MNLTPLRIEIEHLLKTLPSFEDSCVRRLRIKVGADRAIGSIEPDVVDLAISPGVEKTGARQQSTGNRIRDEQVLEPRVNRARLTSLPNTQRNGPAALSRFKFPRLSLRSARPLNRHLQELNGYLGNLFCVLRSRGAAMFRWLSSLRKLAQFRRR